MKATSFTYCTLITLAVLSTICSLPRAAARSWNQEQILLPFATQNGAQFGTAVHVNGTEAAIGMPFADGTLANSGIVYVWRRSGAQWTLEGGPGSSVKQTGAYFGSSVAIDGDRLYAGSPGYDQPEVNRGAVEVFHYAAGEWSESGALGGGEGDRYGSAIAYDSGLIAIGIPGPCTSCGPSGGTGKVGVSFDFENVALYATIFPHDGSNGDGFGASVAVYKNPDASAPDLLAIGAPFHHVEGAGDLAGAVYLYANANHVPSGWHLVAQLTAANPHESDLFGFSIAIGPQRLIVGAPDRDRVTPTPVSNAGAVFVFVPNDVGAWEQESQLFLNDAGTNDLLGKAVAYDPLHDRIFGGAPQRLHSVFGGSGDTGSVTVFERSMNFPGAFERTAELFSVDFASIGQRAGQSLSVSGDRLFVGAPGYDANPNNGITDSGRVFIYTADAIFADGFTGL